MRDASSAQIGANAEIQNIKQILGLQHGKVYEDVKSLRYGHVMIMTDQDHDGSHIKGLIMNFLHAFYPSLLKIPGFLLQFITPIVKVSLVAYWHCDGVLVMQKSWRGLQSICQHANITVPTCRHTVLRFYKTVFLSTTEQASKGKKRHTFYTMPEYEAWKESLGGVTTGWSIKYYKVWLVPNYLSKHCHILSSPGQAR